MNGSTNPYAAFAIVRNVQATAVFRTSLANGLDTPPSMVLTSAGIGEWYGQYEVRRDGVDAAISPALGTNQQSRFTTQVTGPGTLSFWWKVSSRVNSGRLTLLINNQAQTTPAPISGTTGDWAEVVVDLPAGPHSIAWRYSRDGNSLIDGENRGYVDQLRFVREGVQDDPLQLWLAGQFTESELAEPEISDLNADPDGDGIVNLIEAAIGTSAKSRDSMELLLSVITTGESDGERTITLAANRALSPVANLKLEIQASNSLIGGVWNTLVEKSGNGNWLGIEAGVDPPVEGTAVAGSVPLVVKESVALPANAHRFYRLLVTVIPSP